jgi:hypothetical protein
MRRPPLTMLMVMPVAIAVGMPMKARIDQVDDQQQILVGQNFLGCTASHQDMVFAEDQDPVSDLFHNFQIVGGGDQGLTCFAELDQYVDQPALAANRESPLHLKDMISKLVPAPTLQSALWPQHLDPG